ncbi:hypothetical protein KFL_006520090 [Klebsormidium nitens]|uniref:Uncharacterized protein n=1 Tax=Klebsormidium nitens TaxID=105231 RepID=A0A1Y1IIK0_KLENI|nr:hypothetical protein KFL_006520090 [Klebsormidium nitens]|eukprot:GAQ90533.1 hypothetical protein KFL_006520090 [Klebsormidium nitens]
MDFDNWMMHGQIKFRAGIRKVPTRLLAVARPEPSRSQIPPETYSPLPEDHQRLRQRFQRKKQLLRCWLRERGLPIFDEEDRIRREDGFNANFSVVDDPAASLEYEGMSPPEQPQQPKQQPPEEQQLKYAGEGDVGGGATQQQRDERSGQVSEGVSAFWGIPGFSAWLRDLPDIDVDLNKLDYNTDPNDEVTSPPSLLPVVSDKGTCPSVELDLRRHFLVAATRYLMRVVGSANEQLKDCEAADQQMMQEIIGSNVRLVMEVQGYILQ